MSTFYRVKEYYLFLPLYTKLFFFAMPIGIGAIYSNSFSAPFYMDDYHNIVLNSAIRIEKLNWSQLEKISNENFISLRGLSYITFAVNHFFGGYNPFGYHLINIILHSLNSWLVFLFIFKTLSFPSLRLRGTEALSAASLASILWALHPVQTNVAVYIVQRMTSLSAFFFLLSFILYINGRTLIVSSKVKSFSFFILSGFCWAISLFCKENTVMLPFLIFIYDCLFFRDRDLRKRIYYGIAILTILSLAGFISAGGTELIDKVMRTYEWRNFTLKERLLTEMRVVFYYLGLLFVPNPDRLTLFYEGYPISRSFFSPWTTAASFIGLVLSGVCVALALLYRRFVLAFGILWYFVNLVVESTFLGLELVYEHRVYLPSIGVFALVSLSISRINLSFPKLRRFIGILLFLFVLSEIFGTLLRNEYWSGKTVFYEDALEKNPSSIRVLANLSLEYKKQGALELSEECLNKALKIDPVSLKILPYYYILLKKMGRNDQASDILKKTDELLKEGRYNRTDVSSVEILATYFFEKDKNNKKAIEYLNYITKVNSHYAYNFMLGVAHLNMNNPREALKYFEKAIKGSPQTAKYNFYLALTYRILGRFEESGFYLEKTLQLSPSKELSREMDKIMKSGLWNIERPTPN